LDRGNYDSSLQRRTALANLSGNLDFSLRETVTSLAILRKILLAVVSFGLLMCEDFCAHMTLVERENLAMRKALFALLMGVIAAALAYSVTQNGPWTVPDDAKQLKNPIPPSDEVLTATGPLYLDKCANCHGATGKGDGHDASQYDPSPTNFTDLRKMEGVTDGELFYKISHGRKPMPSFQKGLSAEQRWQLVLLIRSFSAQK
jgi:mono/diheme cytochrome c family protein